MNRQTFPTSLGPGYCLVSDFEYPPIHISPYMSFCSSASLVAHIWHTMHTVLYHRAGYFNSTNCFHHWASDLRK